MSHSKNKIKMFLLFIIVYPLPDLKRITPTSVRFYLEIAVSLNDWFDATNEGIKGIVGIRFLWPETITYFLLGEGVII